MMVFVPHLNFRYLCNIVRWHAFDMRKFEKNMKTVNHIILFVSWCFCCYALNLNAQVEHTSDSVATPWDKAVALPDTAHAVMDDTAPVYDGLDAAGFLMNVPGSLDSWDNMPLHQGLNAQFGMSVSAAWGKYAPQGVGFGQHLNLMYVAPVTSRLSIAAGLSADNLTWGGDRLTSLNLMGAASYRLTDRVNVFAYGAKRLMPQRAVRGLAAPYFYDHNPDYVYGGGFDFKLGEHSWLQISIESRKESYPAPPPYHFERR